MQETSVSFKQKTDAIFPERCVLSEIREVYKKCGVEEACVLESSESDVDERDSILRQVKEELKNIGYLEP